MPIHSFVIKQMDTEKLLNSIEPNLSDCLSVAQNAQMLSVSVAILGFYC